MESSSIHSAVTGRERFGESSLRSTATVARISAARTTIEITMMEIMRIIGYSIERISSILRESNRATGTAVLVEREFIRNWTGVPVARLLSRRIEDILSIE